MGRSDHPRGSSSNQIGGGFQPAALKSGNQRICVEKFSVLFLEFGGPTTAVERVNFKLGSLVTRILIVRKTSISV